MKAFKNLKKIEKENLPPHEMQDDAIALLNKLQLPADINVRHNNNYISLQYSTDIFMDNIPVTRVIFPQKKESYSKYFLIQALTIV